MKKRSAQKESSLQNILQAGATRLREEGTGGCTVASVMKDAGLTHGAFYSHFTDKNQLLIGSLRQALADNRPRWLSDQNGEQWPERLGRLAARYLTPAHRDHLASSCALAALASETCRADDGFRTAYSEELEKTLAAICASENGLTEAREEEVAEAIMLLSLCIGGINLARAVGPEETSERILAACRQGASRLTYRGEASPVAAPAPGKNKRWRPASIAEFAAVSREKLRYGDTDRQGHVNNAVFATMLETGRVEILYDQTNPLASPGCAFVIASQQLDFLSEIHWPGEVAIGTRVEKIGRSSISFGQALFQQERLCATAATVVVQMNEVTRRSASLSGQTIDRLKKLGI